MSYRQSLMNFHPPKNEGMEMRNQLIVRDMASTPWGGILKNFSSCLSVALHSHRTARIMERRFSSGAERIFLISPSGAILATAAPNLIYAR